MRLGAKKRPFYRIVATDSRNPRESKVKDILGHYDPLKDPSEIKIDLKKAKEAHKLPKQFNLFYIKFPSLRNYPINKT
jgi:small subunit ribosomal protein S16